MTEEDRPVQRPGVEGTLDRVHEIILARQRKGLLDRLGNDFIREIILSPGHSFSVLRSPAGIVNVPVFDECFLGVDLVVSPHLYVWVEVGRRGGVAKPLQRGEYLPDGRTALEGRFHFG